MLSVILIALVRSSFSPDHAITFDVVAPYHEVPLFDQLLYFLAGISQYSTKSFIQSILSNYSDINNKEVMLGVAEALISPALHQLMYAKLENHYYVPRGEAFRRIADELDPNSDLIIINNEQNGTNFDQQYNTATLPDDINFGNSNIVVYANFHNETAANEIISILSSRMTFTLRPFTRNTKKLIDLPGFYVELQPNVKNELNNDEDNLNIIKEEFSKYETVSDETIGKLTGIPPSYTNPILMNKIGPKLASFIRNDGSPLPEILKDICSNLPLFMPLIVSSQETSADQSSYQKVSKYLDDLSYSISLLNGRSLSNSNIDLFGILDVIQQEYNFRTVLERYFKMEYSQINDFSTMSTVPDEEYIFDYRTHLITYLNDLETDDRYINWSTNINDIYSMKGPLPEMKKNLINIILFHNPTTYEGASALFNLIILMQQGYPVRFGFLPYFNLNDKFERKVAYAFHYFAIQNPIVGIQYLVNVFQTAGINPDTGKLNHFDKQLFQTEFDKLAKDVGSQLSWDTLFFLHDSQSSETTKIMEINQFIKDSGIHETTAFINGKFIHSPEITPSVLSIEINAMYLIIQKVFEQAGIQSLNNVDIMELLLQVSPKTKSIDKRVFGLLPIGLNLFLKPIPTQVAFCDFISGIHWDYSDNDHTSAFAWLFYPEGTDLTNFYNFMQSEHLISTSFAFNPPIPESVYKVNKNIVTLIYNGRVYEDVDLSDTKFLNLLDFYSSQYTYEAISILNKNIRHKRKDALIYLSCVLIDWKANNIVRSNLIDDVWKINSTFIYQSNSFGMNWDIVINPFSHDCKNIAPLAAYFAKTGVVNVRMVLVPPLDITSSDLQFINSYSRMAIGDEKAVFTLLNETTSYKTYLHLPLSWQTELLASSIDPNNINLENIEPGIHSIQYLLSNLIVEGRSFDELGEIPECASVAFIDEYKKSNDIKYDPKKKIGDTTIMKTNGYFQLKANPGSFSFVLDDDRTKKIYNINNNDVLIASFSPDMYHLQLKHNKEFTHYKIIDLKPSSHKRNTLDIFAFASGYVDETFLKIGMLSIIRQTNQKVKFWFLKSFLSPQFKAILNKFSKEYSFEYQFVSYRWPRWLHEQTDPIKKMNGYRVFFLDTLFPLDVDKIVCIDATIFAKSDLCELFNIDIEEASYAFPSFGESRTESEPYRYWKSGYLQRMLHGKPYHSSSVFVVDLKKFREKSIGDWLRFHYQMFLSEADIHTKFDEFVFNSAQIQCEIYTLPEKWAWFDKYCDHESFSNAKAIVLSENSIDKRSRIQTAKKYIRNWEELYEESINITAGDLDFYNNCF
ncbi:hypothetical protein TRFO_08292 [Tritrichomonas foetus]|uniref:Glucosyltransferase 24 catalytic domain-containing protein n=1 Tax=Tritrichomonas foetus TaxID=1144522 RepID=A0A1J4JQ54_9EUKA|nr:hypothetical protein TRFO_08292 [Tritrichomonas foetus]|eukprot:OHS99661.1 hypothetical protein TRFO_08292 [Tritrichomonas foetus]